MKEKDFDDIGKRLYDVEANPPKNGWKKIGSGLHGPVHIGKVVWLRKNWWKPLIVIIPFGLYFLYSGLEKENLPTSLSPDQESQESSVERSSERSDTILSELEVGDIRTESINKNQESGTLDNQSSNQTAKKTIEQGEKDLTSKENNATMTPVAEQVQRLEAEKDKSKINERDQEEVDGDVYIQSIRDAKAEDALLRISEVSTPPITISNGQSGHAISSEEALIIPSESALSNRVDSPLIMGEKEAVEQASPSQSTDVQNHHTTYALDSTDLEKIDGPTRVSDTVIVNSETLSKNAVGGGWRLTVSITPQYASKSVKPKANDEVLVTEIDNSRNSHRIGLGFAMGVGKAITQTFFIDAQVSYADAQQSTYFSYATGKVDTLLAMQQPDQSVRVTPVYEIGNREISSKFSYGGIKLGATHYFWSSARKRFNISAMAGAHYLISATVKEHLNGQWIELNSDDLNKVNYSLMVSGGYNINLNRGWELMLNPTFTYFLRKVKNGELPYNLNQQAFGLNFMLSKTLGKK